MQGAAAGAFSSMAGSAFGAWCPDNIADSFGGVTAFSAVVGGAGAYLGGARSPAEILMGVAAGAMVGALNHGAHEMQRKLTLKDNIGKLATSLGISKDVTEKLIRFAIQGKNFKDVNILLKTLKVSGYTFAGASIVIDFVNVYNNPTTSNMLRLAGDAAIIASGPVGGAIYGFLEISGVNNKMYDYLGNGIDQSIEKISNTYYNIQQVSNPTNWVKTP